MSENVVLTHSSFDGGFWFAPIVAEKEVGHDPLLQINPLPEKTDATEAVY
jgi:hypothetical protein